MEKEAATAATASAATAASPNEATAPKEGNGTSAPPAGGRPKLRLHIKGLNASNQGVARPQLGQPLGTGQQLGQPRQQQQGQPQKQQAAPQQQQEELKQQPQQDSQKDAGKQQERDLKQQAPKQHDPQQGMKQPEAKQQSALQQAQDAKQQQQGPQQQQGKQQHPKPPQLQIQQQPKGEGPSSNKKPPRTTPKAGSQPSPRPSPEPSAKGSKGTPAAAAGKGAAAGSGAVSKGAAAAGGGATAAATPRLSPDVSPRDPLQSPSGPAVAAAAASLVERGLQRIPAGEVGAGLPVVEGGSSKQDFDAELERYWAARGMAGERVPSRNLHISGMVMEPWAFWREVWAFGGPEEVQTNKLWATVGHSFSPPIGATSISSRMKNYYEAVMGPLDRAVDAGLVKLERPTANRLPTDRLLQLRAPVPPGARRRTSQAAGSGSAAPSPSSSMAAEAAPGAENGTTAASGGRGASVSRGSTPVAAAVAKAVATTPAAPAAAAAAAAASLPAPAAAPAAAAAGDGGEGDAAVGTAAGAGSRAKRKRSSQQQRQRQKRQRPGAWSDNDEGDGIAAADVASEDSLQDVLMSDSSSDDEGHTGRHAQQQQQKQQRRQQQQQKQQELSSSAGQAKSSSSKRLRVTVSQVKEDMVAGGLDSAGGYEYLRQPTDIVVLGKIRLTPAAQGIQVGDCVDFRLPSSSGKCVSGWRSGTVLAVAPGSEWEGGKRLLIKPRHTHHPHTHAHNGGLHSSQHSLPTDSPAAAALAAVAAAGGPTGGGAAEAAAQKLLTRSGHLRHEVAGLLPARSGSLKLSTAADPAAAAAGGASAATAGSAGSGQRQGSGGTSIPPEEPEQPHWVPMVWRGASMQPFLAPPVLVRPHYAPKVTLTLEADAAAGAGATAAAAAAGKSPFASPTQQHHHQQQLRVGTYVEVLREGCWCPAQVLEVVPAGAKGAGGSSSSGACVVLRSVAPPEADGGVWRCSGTHPLRPMHPRYTSGCGVVQCEGPEELITVQAMRKALAPYMYAFGRHGSHGAPVGGIQAFACMDHMVAARDGSGVLF